MINNGRRNLVRVVEAAYQLELDEKQWLERLAEVFGSMRGSAHGLMVYLYDARHPQEGVDIPAYALEGLDEDFARGTILHNKNSPAEEIRRVYHNGVVCGTVSEILEPLGILPRDHESFAMARRFAGIEDAWGLSASGPTGCGVGIAAPLAEVSHMSESMRELWGLVGVHLANAYRLRRRTDGEDDEAAAIFAPDGRLLHTGDVSISERDREHVGHAMRQIDRARSQRLRQEPDEALPLWKGLVEGRWSLVDRRDSDGRRFIIAHPNDPHLEEPKPLDKRERQVVAYACQGDSNARISYALGLDEETVASVLQQALDKLNVESREELVRLHRFLSR